MLMTISTSPEVMGATAIMTGVGAAKAIKKYFEDNKKFVSNVKALISNKGKSKPRKQL